MTDNIKFYLPEFPSNMLNLQRGSLLKAARDIPQLGIKKGDPLPLGFDGKYVRCMGLTWSIDRIVQEILDGFWEVMESPLDLSDPDKMRDFVKFIEQRDATMLS